MKIRNGFVSNSSSSSFIIGLANVGQESGDFTFDVSREENDWVQPNLPYNVQVTKRGEDYKLVVDSFMYSEVEISAKPGDNILLLDSVGPSGDSYFDNGGWIDYDIGLDEFYDNDIDKYSTIISAGGDATYGAGRNG